MKKLTSTQLFYLALYETCTPGSTRCRAELQGCTSALAHDLTRVMQDRSEITFLRLLQVYTTHRRQIRLTGVGPVFRDAVKAFERGDRHAALKFYSLLREDLPAMVHGGNGTLEYIKAYLHV